MNELYVCILICTESVGGIGLSNEFVKKDLLVENVTDSSARSQMENFCSSSALCASVHCITCA